MLRAFAPDADDGLVEVDPSDALAGLYSWVWLDVALDDPDEVWNLAGRFDLNHLAVEDATTETHTPKVDDFGTHIFVVLHSIGERAGRVETVELDAFLGSDFLITVRSAESPSIAWVLENASKPAVGPDVILARIADVSSRRMLPVIDSLDTAVDDLEERAIGGGDIDIVPEIQALRRDAIRLRRVLIPQRDMLTSLSTDPRTMVSARAALRFGSARDNHVRVADSLDTARVLLGSVLETYRGAVAERMNEVMKVLTVYAAILLPLSVLTGIYGMNFSNMPELGWNWGYFGLLGLMATVAVGQWIYFARRGFIGAFKFRAVPRTIGRGLVRVASLPVDIVTMAIGLRDDATDAAREED